MFKLAGCFAVFLLAFVGSSYAQSIAEPGGRPEDASMALSNPDEYAWKLFLYINRQAKRGIAGNADETKSSIRDYDPNSDVVWETWALASGLVTRTNPDGSLAYVDNKSEVYKRPAAPPEAWDRLNRAKPKVPFSPNFKGIAGLTPLIIAPSRRESLLLSAPIGVPPGDEEVRMNRSTYETIINKHLYSIEGLEVAAQLAKQQKRSSVVEFEPMSKEVKAQWVPLTTCEPDKDCPDKLRYHWRIVTNPDSNKQEVWGLAALHVITKDISTWFWADFGHIDCETGQGACTGFKAEADNSLRDSTTSQSNGRGAGPAGVDGKRNETLNSKWENYRLRGTQTSFVKPDGVTTILSNPVIENRFQRSSCMTCHAYATVGIRGTVPNRGSSLPRFMGLEFVHNIGSSPPPFPDLGSPICSKFYNAASGPCPDEQTAQSPLYFQTDFLWSIPFRVFSEKP